MKIGDKADDGTILAGVSPDTNKAMFVIHAIVDKLSVEQAKQYAQNLEVGGHKDFRVPSYSELSVIMGNNNKGALTTFFNKPNTGVSGFFKEDKTTYGSSTPGPLVGIWSKSADTGKNWNCAKSVPLSYCFVRDDETLKHFDI